MNIREVLVALEKVAPLPLQAGFDNAGLQVGLTEARVSGALLCLDVTEAVVDEAVATGCNLIVSHHPLLFHPLRRISEEDYIGRCVIKAIKNDIAIISMHTNLDAAQGGVNFKIAERIGLVGVRFIGEEKEADGVKGSDGVMGVLPAAMDEEEFIMLLKERFNVDCVETNEPLRRQVSKVAICGGAGSFLLDEAIRRGADAFITGEMKYNTFFDHGGQILIAVLGHYQSEQFTTEIFRSILEEAGVKTVTTSVVTNPIRYI
ncbi:MAG: Nif3-like dinuclear metal center hexameric protein [Prevotella sp.]|nr:Nif3-like dinuclear metal center hexameric protein [Prevotella sp.]